MERRDRAGESVATADLAALAPQLVVLAVVTYLGLVFGGYLSVPPLLSPLANLWWSYQ